MKQGLVCFLLVVGISYVYSFVCECGPTTQRDIWKNSDFVAKVQFNHEPETEDSDWLVYNTTFLEIFKPRNSTKPTSSVVVSTNNCSIPIMSGIDYLIAAQKNDTNYEIIPCHGFPQHKEGRPIPAMPFDLITNATLASLRSGKF